MRELKITSIADVPSGDCGWQFALTTINSAQAYFGGDHLLNMYMYMYVYIIYYVCRCNMYMYIIYVFA